MPNYNLVDVIFCMSVILTLIIYFYRYYEIWIGLHQPSLATWVMYFLNAFFSAIFAWQTDSGIWLTASLALNAVLIGILLILSLRSAKKYGHTNWKYKPFDILVALIAGAIILLYYLGLNVVIGAVALWLATRLAELPTTRKVCRAPFSEIVWVDVLGAIRSFLLFFTLTNINMVGICSTIGSAVVMLLIAGWCYYNQHRLAKKSHESIRAMRRQLLKTIHRRVGVNY